MSTEHSEEVRDLKDLVSSPGWARFLDMVNAAYGPDATLQALEAKLGKLPMGHQDAVDDMTQHIISAAKAVRGVVQLPKERLSALTGQAQVSKPFALWRRA